MRAILLLAILVPIAVGAAAFVGRRIAHALNARARQVSTPDRIRQIEAENAELDALRVRLEGRQSTYQQPDDHWVN